MTRPTILDLDLVVVPREASNEMMYAYRVGETRKRLDIGSSWLTEEPEAGGGSLGYGLRAAISASPYPTAWDDVRKYVEGLELELAKANNEFGCQSHTWPDLWRRIADLKEYQRKAELRADAAEARIAELDAALDEKEVASGLTDNGNLWRFWAMKASAVAVRNAELEKRLADAERVIDLAEEYIIDGITTAKEQYEMNAPYPAREPGYRAALNDARAAHAAARAYMEGK